MRLDRGAGDKSKRAGSLIILPERGVPRARILMPIPDREWRDPSQRLYTYGIPNKTRFRLTARTHDGLIVWRGFFDDRADADVFLHAIATGSIRYDRKLWSLPNETWTPRERYGNVGFTGELLDPGLVYDFATITYLTSGAGSNQTWTVPSDWNASNNTVEAIGGGASGHGQYQVAGGGGAGGDYAKSVNLTGLTPGGSVTYRCGAGATGGTGASTAGGDSWFNDTAFPTTGQRVGAKGGAAATSSGASAGNTANDYATGTGNAKYAGGGGGALSSNAGSGGGGAAGPAGAGKDGGTTSGSNQGGGGGGGSGNGSAGAANSGTTGGAGGNNSNGTGGGAASSSTPNNGSSSSGYGAGGGSGGGASGSSNVGGIGGSGQEWDSTHGSGGGGGGATAHTNGNSTKGGASGSYGGGAGGGGCSGVGSNSIGGNSAQGIVVPTYTPAPLGMAFGINTFSHMIVR